MSNMLVNPTPVWIIHILKWLVFMGILIRGSIDFSNWFPSENLNALHRILKIKLDYSCSVRLGCLRERK